MDATLTMELLSAGSNINKSLSASMGGLEVGSLHVIAGEFCQ